tara:strand:+ start:14738 stop:15328 length:591 start_codon:yes stop_codon:yes gene_type:complete
MQLGKIVSITCLTYVIYGVTSAFQFGTFLPPIPLKPFIYLLFVILGVAYIIYHRLSKFNYFLLAWILLVAVNSNAFLEVFTSTENMILYESKYQVLLELIKVILFGIHGMLLLFIITKDDRRYGIFFLPLIGGITFHFLSSADFPFQAVIIGWAMLMFILDRAFGEKYRELFRLSPIVFGMGVVEVVEMISLLNAA